MFILKNLFVVIFLLNSVKSEDADDLYNHIREILKGAETYQLPINNEKVFSTSDAELYDYGKFDFIIVGGGSAGAVLANRLSEVPEWQVLLLEAGGDLTKFSDILGFNNYLQKTDMNWGYLTSPQSTCCQGMINHQCVYPRGKVVGGCSTLNAAIYSRGSPSDYDGWAAMGNPGWSYEEVLPYFKKSEYVALKSYDKEFHGSNGLLYVNHTFPPSVTAETFLNANLEKGLKEIDYNGKFHLGVSKLQFNIKDNSHQNSARAFLDPVRTRPNLKIVLNAAVNKILFKKRDQIKSAEAHSEVYKGQHELEGVTFIKDGKIYKVKANNEVILSAGAINTPQLLLLSGIGPKDELENLNIPVKLDFPAVGKHLQDHPLFVNIYFRTNLSSPNYSLKENLERRGKGMTPLTNGAGLEQVVFYNVNNDVNSDADIEFLTIAPPLGVPGNPTAAYNFKPEFSRIYEQYNPTTDISVIMSLMKPKSEGSVTLQSNSILDFPLININYFSDEGNEDLKTMYKGIKYLLSLPETEAFKKVNAKFISEQPGCEHLKDNDQEYWYCALRHMTSTEFHPSCTTRMGPSVDDSVVDANCLVHNFRNLRIVDAGVVPTITRGHLNAAVYMIAEKISDVIKKEHNKV